MAQAWAPTGTWRQTNVTWKRPPAKLQLKQRYAEAAVLYFSTDQRFVLLYGTIIQGPTSEELSQGDGRVVYLGTWKLVGDSVHVQFRLVSRTIAIEGETLPGPLQNDNVQAKSGVIEFKRDLFGRAEKLDQQLNDILRGESARLALSERHP